MIIRGIVNTEGCWHCVFKEKYKIYTQHIHSTAQFIFKLESHGIWWSQFLYKDVEMYTKKNILKNNAKLDILKNSNVSKKAYCTTALSTNLADHLKLNYPF